MSNDQLPRIFIRTDEQARIPYFAVPPVASGGDTGSYAFEHRAVDAGSLGSHTFDAHVLMLPVGPDPVRFWSRLNGRPVSGLIEPGRFRFLAHGDTLATSWNAPLQGLFLTLPQALFAQALGDSVDTRPIELVSRLTPHEDRLLAHLLHAIQAYAMGQRLGGRLFEQSLLTAVAAHVSMTYGAGRRELLRGPSLPRWKQQRLRQFIQEHLSSDLNLNALAAMMNMSPYHLGRVFRATTGRTLWQFVLECRAKEAHRWIAAHPTLPLSKIAEACGFESYSQFIAVFRKFYGQRPSEFRRSL
ncbi:putative AraC family transcriptional regulator [Thiomonas sp. X19]|uniref:AraC family transcriptional regulator n=1 Tax=Thiomonas sp. X19 TaxID=1050370 RepID=UPI000B6EA8F0|nr:AraC family transcriptional regulator [Thiomonas sp. X19]SCC91261.1 putative AraC family transcriptional regulator [Thiomonas sp. X19]